MTKAQFIESNIKEVCMQYAKGKSKRQLAKEYNVTLGYFLQLWENFEYRGLIPKEIVQMHEASKNDARNSIMREKRNNNHNNCISCIKKLELADTLSLACRLGDKAEVQKCIEKVVCADKDSADYMKKNLHKVCETLDIGDKSIGYERLARAILYINTVDEFVKTFGGCRLDEDRIAGVEHILGTLYPREAEVIKARFITNGGLSLEQTGIKFGVTRERVRQIEAKALRKLRHPSRYKYLKYGYNGTLRLNEEHRLERERNIAARMQLAKTNPVAYAKSIKVDDLQISVRLYNCLTRAGIKTLGDIKSMEQLRSIRNMGAKTIDEAQEIIKQYGLVVN